MRIVGLARERLQKQLYDLAVREISTVTKGANPHARVLLRKSQETEMPVMSQETAVAKAANVWNSYVELTAKKAGVSINKAVDLCLKTELGREAFDLAKHASAADVLKLGGGNLKPNGQIDGGSGRHDTNTPGDEYPDPPSARRADAKDYAQPRDRRAPRDQMDDEAVAQEAFQRFTAAVNQCVGDGMSRTKAMDHCMAKFPALWNAAKTYKIKGSVIAGG
jgi:hypothetical protein